MTTRFPTLGSGDEEIDLRSDPEPVPEAEERWVTVNEAAELAGVSGAAIRGWYRSGRIPTQRADGDQGAYLVPLTAVLRLGALADEQGDDLGDPVVDINASYWSLETAAARDEATAARAEAAAARDELAEVRSQMAFLREQLAEATAGERAATARVAAAEAELGGLRAMAAATSSITDSSWLSLSTNRYESPVRSQGLPAPVAGPVLVPAPMPVTEVPADVVVDGHAAETEDDVAVAAEHFRPGEHADDMLPVSEKKGRRGRR